MVKFKQTEELLALMKNKTHIRNMGIIAHIDHGKCVSGDTKIYLDDGKIVRAEDLFNQVSPSCKIVKETSNEIVYDGADLSSKIYSLNKETGKIETHPIKYIWKLKGGSLLNIELRTGFKISTTPEHKYLVFNGADFVEKPADKIKLGDRVVCARNLPIQSNVDLKSEFLRIIAKESGFYANVTEKFSKDISLLMDSFGIDKVIKKVTELSKGSFITGFKKNRFRLEDIIKICNLFKINLDQLYNEIEFIRYRSGKNGMTNSKSIWRGKNSNKMFLPKSFEDLFNIAGLMIGEGSYNKLVVGKEKLGEQYSRICRDLGFKPYWRKYEGKCPELSSRGGKTFLMVLNRLFDYPLRKKSHNVRVSKFVYNAPDSCVASYIKGYFDCDGGVEKSRSAVSIYSVSKQMLKDLHHLLLRFGCLSEFHKDTLYISGSSAKKFLENIGFSLEEKQQKLVQLCDKSIGSQIIDMIPINGDLLGNLRGNLSKTSIDHHFYKYENNTYIPTHTNTQRIITKLEEKGVYVEQIQKLLSSDIAYVEVTNITEDFAEYVYDFTVEPHHNFVAEGMIIHNTTLSDSLLSASGLLARSIAGQARALDYLEEEQERGITIKAANISLLYENEGQEYVINMIDTPGHVDFSGNVTRALRVIDSAVVVVDAVEEVMVQTETVTKQAVEERVRPLLYINKVDRIIRELKLNPEQFQAKLIKIIKDFNQLIDTYADPEFRDQWKVDPAKGTVALGSALHGWGFTIPQLQAAGWTFKDLVDAYNNDERDKLKDTFPVHRCILDMVIRHGPNPLVSQKYRLERIWGGDLDSDIGKSMVTCDDNGPLVICLNNVAIDPHAGVVATGRVFSGSVSSGSQVYLILGKAGYRIQQVSMYMGAKREVVGKISAGNIVALLGLSNARSGDTVVLDGRQEDIKPFEEIVYVSEPVVTIAVEPTKPSDLPKLIETMQRINIQDPNLRTTINEETGEYLLSGMGELHLEVSTKDIARAGVPITISQPIVVYRESTMNKAGPVLGKSPNKHNRIFLTVEPLSEETSKLISKGKITNNMDAAVRAKILREAGWDTKEAKKLWLIDAYGNMMVDSTKGVQFLREIRDNFLAGWEDGTAMGPLCKEPIRGCLFRLVDVKLHEDSIHRGPAQIIPPAKSATYGAFLLSDPMLLEPIYKIQVQVPNDYLGTISGVLNQRRGQVKNIEKKGHQSVVTGMIPVSETFGLSSDLRSKTSGHAFWQTQFSHWAILPKSLSNDVILSIRKRKGMTERIPDATDYIDKL
ncbi:MAG: elongation factor EF-2 [Candidatus Ranarchaeia archaeon]